MANDSDSQDIFSNGGVLGTPETGYYRDPRARGLKSGRISPRVPKRLPARDRIDMARGLVNPGDVDMNQGSLYHPDEIAVTPLSDLAKRDQVPMLRASSMPGFLPGVEGSETGRVSSTQRKIKALKSFSENLVTPEKTIASSVAHAESFMPGVAPEPGSSWYEDKAADAIVDATSRAAHKVKEATGEPSHLSSPQMRRSVAYFSAQRPWDVGIPSEGTYRISNVENVVDLPAHVARGEDPRTYTVPAVRGGFPVAGKRAMPQTGDVQEKSAEVIKGNVNPSDPHSSEADKIATFDSGLSLGMTRSQPLRRHLHQAMVIDTHQARVAGLPDYDVVANREGGYDVAAMVNRRAALRSGVKQLNAGFTPATPIEGQEGSWKKIREQGGQPLGMMSLLTEDPKTGQLVPNDFDKVSKWNDKVTEQVTSGIPEPRKKTSKGRKSSAKKK